MLESQLSRAMLLAGLGGGSSDVGPVPWHTTRIVQDPSDRVMRSVLKVSFARIVSCLCVAVQPGQCNQVTRT